MALVDLGLHDPVPQSLGIDPELLAHTTERSRLRRWILPRVHGHPRGPLPKLIGVLPRCCHAPHPPVDSEPPPDPGRFTLPGWSPCRAAPVAPELIDDPFQESGTDRRSTRRWCRFPRRGARLRRGRPRVRCGASALPLLRERPAAYSARALPRCSGRVNAAMAASTKNTEKAAKTNTWPPASRNTGTRNGASIEAMRPKAAAAPVPVPRTRVG